jgi:hypothetical protein
MLPSQMLLLSCFVYDEDAVRTNAPGLEGREARPFQAEKTGQPITCCASSAMVTELSSQPSCRHFVNAGTARDSFMKHTQSRILSRCLSQRDAVPARKSTRNAVRCTKDREAHLLVTFSPRTKYANPTFEMNWTDPRAARSDCKDDHIYQAKRARAAARRGGQQVCIIRERVVQRERRGQ